jgi:predicted O-methyltransferase YrrM
MVLRLLRGQLTRLQRWRAIAQLRNGGDSAAALAEALKASVAPPAAAEAAWIKRIEELRSDLAGSVDILGSWTRPWLAESSELRDRMGVRDDAASETFRAADLPVSKAVQASKGLAWCRVLYHLARCLRPPVVVELGTNIGISGLYLAAALEEAGHGTLVTMEGSASKAGLAEANFEHLGLRARTEIIVGDFRSTLPGVLEKHGQQIGLAFIDGFHDGDATVAFHSQFCQASAEPVLVYDDIRWSEGMQRGWDQIQAGRHVSAIVDAGVIGICAMSAISHPDAPRVRWPHGWSETGPA